MKRIFLAAVLPALAAAPALADHVRPVSDPETLQACGECHMAFPPAFLPARSWNRMMDGLADHFGDNASMAPDKVARVRRVLIEGAADTGGGKAGRKALQGLNAADAPLHITKTPRFIAKHEGIPEREWKRPGVVTRSNCVACHKGAERGDFEDD